MPIYVSFAHSTYTQRHKDTMKKPKYVRICRSLFYIYSFAFFFRFVRISPNLIIHLLVFVLYLVSSVRFFFSLFQTMYINFFFRCCCCCFVLFARKLQMVSTEWNFTVHKSPMLIESEANDPIVTVYYKRNEKKMVFESNQPSKIKYTI